MQRPKWPPTAGTRHYHGLSDGGRAVVLPPSLYGPGRKHTAYILHRTELCRAGNAFLPSVIQALCTRVQLTAYGLHRTELCTVYFMPCGSASYTGPCTGCQSTVIRSTCTRAVAYSHHRQTRTRVVSVRNHRVAPRIAWRFLIGTSLLYHIGRASQRVYHFTRRYHAHVV